MMILSNSTMLKVFSAWALLLLLSACSSMVQTETAPPEIKPATEYKIGLADGLKIDVWRRPELSASVVVRPDGMISLPLIGDVLANGQSVTELAETIKLELGNFVKTPEVTVSVVNAVSASYQQRIRVTGAVNSQLSLPYRDGMTVLDVVLEAGGTTVFAAGNKAVLYRKNSEGVLTPYAIRLDDILLKGKLDTNYTLQPSDVITVPEKVF